MALPKVLTINVTTSCDAACRYCHWWRSAGQHEAIDSLCRVVDEAAAMGVVALRLSGGEPLLHPDLPPLVGHIRQHGLVSMVCTAAKDELSALEALLDAGLDLLAVSLDTLQPRVFRQIRGYALEPVLANLHALARQREQRGFEIVLSVVLSGLSLDGLPDVLRLARDLDLLVSLTPYQDATPQFRSAMNTLALHNDGGEKLRAVVRQVREMADQGLRVVNGDAYLEGIADFLTSRKLPAGHVCRAGHAAAIRMAGGALKLCHSLPPLQTSSLAQAWTSDQAAALRARMARLDCPGCWLSCHADTRRPVAFPYARMAILEAL